MPSGDFSSYVVPTHNNPLYQLGTPLRINMWGLAPFDDELVKPRYQVAGIRLMLDEHYDDGDKQIASIKGWEYLAAKPGEANTERLCWGWISETELVKQGYPFLPNV